MKRLLLILLLVMTATALALAVVRPSQALPEYSAQTAEPCATCHVGPSGGGLRTPRGQAWVGSGRPGVVPGLTDALALLGVRLKVNAKDYVAEAGPVKPAEPLRLRTIEAQKMRQWLRAYEGN
ncbi:MAG: hypothetical protein FJ011_19340 [Chloroflexi bacterium]|nr:hypothetical protein [Chloroflexota bacterium]